jgi:hypothetical protein
MDVRTVRENVLREALRTRRSKYFAFFAGMRAARAFTSAERMDVLLDCYAGLRRVDDVVDGDVPLPAQYASREEYVLQRMRNAFSGDIEDDADILLRETRTAARRAGLDVDEELTDMLGSLLFDARRVGTGSAFPAQTLDTHFFMLDIRGTVRGALKVFGEDPAQYEFIEPLGKASRIFYSLRDTDEDLAAGLVNISLEDLHRYGKRPGDIRHDREFLHAWTREQARTGLAFLDAHHQAMNNAHLKLSTRAALTLAYALPAERYFRKAL